MRESSFLRGTGPKRILGGILVALFVAAASWALNRPGKPAAERPAAPVLEFEMADLAQAETRELARALPLTGTLRPITEAAVKAKVAGEIQSLTVREGDSVRAGQVIGRIDATESLARLAGSEADVEAARAQLGVAEKNRATQQALLEKKFISQNAFDATQGNYDVAIARLRAAQASADVSRKTLRDTTLVAPMDGIVSIRHAQPGERVPIDGKIVSIVDLRRLELAVPIPAPEIGAVEIGQPVQFRVEGFGEREFAGRVDRINPAAAAGSRSIEMYAVIDNAEAALRGGLFAQGRLVVGRVANALVVPASAVREERGEQYVFAIENGKVARRVVKPAGEADGYVQIVSGLAPGAQVVRNNLGSLREGAEVRLKQAAAAPAPAAR
jgi:RND family efflux transporter MFP subunit